jgi:hypothetical protein
MVQKCGDFISYSHSLSYSSKPNNYGLPPLYYDQLSVVTAGWCLFSGTKTGETGI